MKALIFFIVMIAILGIRYFIKNWPDVDPIIVICILGILGVLLFVLHVNLT